MSNLQVRPHCLLPGNLVALHNSGERWEARQILWCYDRVTRMLDQHSRWSARLTQKPQRVASAA